MTITQSSRKFMSPPFPSSPLEKLPNTFRPFFGKFPALTLAQKALIEPILQGRDVVLAAGTGSGKTEGVLAPATERLITHQGPFTILYIVPTRALALDMHRRIQTLYQALGLKSGIRTGDSKTLTDAQPHLLILTPESLDVLLGSPNADNQHFLKHLRVMIIDEVHTFLHQERGVQLSYLRRRLEKQVKQPLQTIALSATIPVLEEVTNFFQLKNVFYYQQPAQRTLQPHWVHLKNEAQELIPFFDDLARRWGCQKLLVFANSRKKCEQLFEALSQEGVFANHTLVHYSNLSTKERRAIEHTFRQHRKALCIATSTLEMGIDIGDVDGVVLIGPPPSPTAFLQRIGRANRRQKQVNFWGVCQGADASHQLVRFLALFALAQENHLEKGTSKEAHSVLFQQVLSCLYAKKMVSEASLALLFHEHTAPLQAIFGEMIANNWLKAMPQSGLFSGGWRYVQARKKQQIWSNFPTAEVEFDVILDEEKIAIIPWSIVRQLEIGTLVQLAGRVVKILRIEENRIAREVYVEKAHSSAEHELFWVGVGLPTCYEVAQKMGEILLDISTTHSSLPSTLPSVPQGLLRRTQQLLQQARERIKSSVIYESGMRIRRLKNGLFRYETFLGSIGNFILHHIIKEQFISTIEGLSVRFDELGIECNVWIPIESLKLPDSPIRFQKWISTHLPLLKTAFSWNHWLHALPEAQQKAEIASHLLDLRVLDHFKRYRQERTSPPPESEVDLADLSVEMHVMPALSFEGAPWTLKQERQAWGNLPFPELPIEVEHHVFTASQFQGYVKQDFCPRLARLQHLHYTTPSHPRFCDHDQERQAHREEGIIFKKQVVEHVNKSHHLLWATETCTWREAIQQAIMQHTSLFLVRPTFMVDLFKGSPDFLYIKHEGSQLCLEIWDIKNSMHCTYAHQWRVTFYVYLLRTLLESETFSLPVKLSKFGGVIHRHVDRNKPFARTPFVLSPYQSELPRLISQWQMDATQPASATTYSLTSSCTSCPYFTYCYQETLLQDQPSVEVQALTSLKVESNDFPKNTKRWFFLCFDHTRIHWQCWEDQRVCSDCVLRLEEYPTWEAFQETIIKRLYQEWREAVDQGKNPHFLVYAQEDWSRFQTTFQNTPLRQLWAMHVCHTSMQAVLKTHFTWPITGELTATQIGRCLKVPCDFKLRLSLYHKESPLDLPPDLSLDLYRHIWNWILTHVVSQRVVRFDQAASTTFNSSNSFHSLIHSYLAIEQREKEYRTHAILTFQKNHLSIRVEQFRAIGPCTFLETTGYGRQKKMHFSIDSHVISKFRVGDFLKLSPVGSEIQEGFSVILDSYCPEAKRLTVRSMEPGLFLNPHIRYALDENATDWNAPKIEKALSRLKDPKFRPELVQMLLGKGKHFPLTQVHWAEKWMETHAKHARLNPLQKQALLLPFEKNIGLIEGPPGTGKTHLLVWTLIALIAHATALSRPIKILVTAQTHQAIDHILTKLARTLPSKQISLWKYGRYDSAHFEELGIRPLQDHASLQQTASMLVGATGFGIYQLLEGKHFPQVFDWVVFDEASQVLPSYALLSLIFGKGNALFYGDTKQLPPVLQGSYEHHAWTPRSILEELITRYSKEFRLRLNETYRMNDTICTFASTHWYEGDLRSAVPQEQQKLYLPHYPLFHDLLDAQLDPAQSMVVVPLDHEGCRESSPIEAHWIAQAVKRLVQDYAVSPEEIGIISPHRLQNNTIALALREALPEALKLKLPLVDTVERMQGLEFDIVFFSATASDKEVLFSPFLKDYRRFNVTLTRARKKVLFVASRRFFEAFPTTEKELMAHLPFATFFEVAKI